MTPASESPLFQPLRLGAWEMRNRIVLAPLTRCRASAGRVPNALMAEYYAQRAGAGLILSEATSVSPQGVGIRPRKEFVTPRALELEEIPGIVADYRRAAENAQRAGFDGVEIHGANGYLPDQFLQDSTNRREDRYGGSIENRARFLLEVVDAAVDVWGPERVGLHLSPRCDAHDMGDSDPAATFTYVAEEAGRRRLAFLFIREGVVFPTADGGPGEAPSEEVQLEALREERLMPRMRQSFGGPVIANMNLTPFVAEQLIRRNEADAASWGRLFIANPDLPARLAQGAPLNTPHPETFYAPGSPDPAKGYTDYPRLDEVGRG